MELHLHTKYSAGDSVADVGEYIKKASEDCQSAMAITDFASVGAFSEAGLKKPEGFKLIYGLELPVLSGARVYHATLLSKNAAGREALYMLASETPAPKPALEKARDNLLLGSGCDEGELYSALLAGKPDEELINIAAFYDFIEVQPASNFEFLIEQGKITDINALVENVKKLVNIGKIAGKPVVSVGDVCFSDKEDAPRRESLLESLGVVGSYAKAPLYFRTTAEMLAEFRFLSDPTAWEITVVNTNKIASLCEG
ncbi:MAG: PHP domain-containing protein [Bacillota bacterium]|nr:PHP domain-containing protein [Bacillota bacterium]